MHAIVGALEYLDSRRYGVAVNLSADYLWAVLKTLGRFVQSSCGIVQVGQWQCGAPAARSHPGISRVWSAQ